MKDYDVLHYLAECPTTDCIDMALTEPEREVTEKIQLSKNPEEIADIISDALVKSLLDQIKL